MLPTKWLLVIAALYLLGFIGHALYLKKTVYGDGIYYFSWLRTIAIDDDVDFRNDYALFGVTQPPTSSGLPGNKYSVGPALLWFPYYHLMYTVFRGAGVSFGYQFITGISAVLYTLIGLLLLYRLILQYFNRTLSTVSILSIAFTTNLFYYGSLDTVNSHAASFFVTVLFLMIVLQRQHMFLTGLFLGIVGLVRMQDLVYGVLLLPHVSRKTFLKIFLGIVTGLLPQLLAWHSLYGSFWVNPYLTGSEGFRIHPLRMVDVLFAPGNGLFLWTPVTMAACVGLVLKNKQKKFPHRLFFAIFALQLFIVASWSSFLQGASYSGRMFVSSLPLLAFGLATFYERLAAYRFRIQQYLWVFVYPLSMINMLFILFFLITHS